MSDKLREEHVDKHERELTGGNQIDEEVHLLTHFHRICHSTNKTCVKDLSIVALKRYRSHKPASCLQETSKIESGSINEVLLNRRQPATNSVPTICHILVKRIKIIRKARIRLTIRSRRPVTRDIDSRGEDLTTFGNHTTSSSPATRS